MLTDGPLSFYSDLSAFGLACMKTHAWLKKINKGSKLPAYFDDICFN